LSEDVPFDSDKFSINDDDFVPISANIIIVPDEISDFDQCGMFLFLLLFNLYIVIYINLL